MKTTGGKAARHAAGSTAVWVAALSVTRLSVLLLLLLLLLLLPALPLLLLSAAPVPLPCGALVLTLLAVNGTTAPEALS